MAYNMINVLGARCKLELKGARDYFENNIIFKMGGASQLIILLNIIFTMTSVIL